MGISYSFVSPALKQFFCHPCHAETLHKLRLLIRDELAKHMCYASESQGTGFQRQRRYVQNFGSYNWELLKDLFYRHSIQSDRFSPVVHDFVGFKAFVIQRNMARHRVRKRVRVEIMRLEYPSDLLTAVDLFGESVVKGPRCGRPTIRMPSLELNEGDTCNYIHSHFSLEEEKVFYERDHEFVKHPTTCGIDFKYDGVGCLTIFTRYTGVSYCL